jgi:hypothetical protein
MVFAVRPKEQGSGQRWGQRRRWWNRAAGLILLVGLSTAAFIYRGAANNPNVVEVSQRSGKPASAYQLPPGDSKQYFSDLENVGGKAAVLSDRFHWWLADLWHGRRLALTLAALASALALACWLVGRLGAEPGLADGAREGQR